MGESESEELTPLQMTNWLRQHLADLCKAHELRVKEATEITTAYALGTLSSAEANARWNRYHNRWGEEVISGMNVGEGITDEQIVEHLDSVHQRGHGERLPGHARQRQIAPRGGEVSR